MEDIGIEKFYPPDKNLPDEKRIICEVLDMPLGTGIVVVNYPFKLNPETKILSGDENQQRAIIDIGAFAGLSKEPDPENPGRFLHKKRTANFGLFSEKIRGEIQNYLQLDLPSLMGVNEIIENAAIHTPDDKRLFGIKCVKEKDFWKIEVFNFSRGELPPDFIDLIKDIENISLKEAEKKSSDFSVRQTQTALVEEDKSYDVPHHRGILMACNLCEVKAEKIEKDGQLGYLFTITPRTAAEVKSNEK